MGSTAARKDRSRSRLFWPLSTVLGLILVATVFISAQVSSNAERDEAQTRNSQVVQSITREQQVVLLSLGIQGIVERTQDSKLFGQDYRLFTLERGVLLKGGFGSVGVSAGSS